jgi:dipeptidyl aminopeptidase/acylaminoacyl peptidase
MTQLIPRTVLFGNPERTSPRLSPDGDRLAWIAPRDGVLNVWVAPVRVDPGQQDAVDWAAAEVVTDDRDRGIRMFTWAHDGRHLLYIQDTGGDENWRLHDVDLETGQRRDLTPFSDVQVQIVASNKKFPTEILIGLNRDNPQLHDVYRLDLLTGDLTLVEKNPGFAGWEADDDLAVRAAYAPLPDGSMNLMVRDRAGDEWRLLMTFAPDDAGGSGVVSFSQDGQSLLVITPADANTSRLLRVDVATGTTEVLAEDPEADVDGVELHPDTLEPQFVTVLKDREEFIVLDPAIEADLKAVRALHPGDPSIGGREQASSPWLVTFSNDAGPVAYFVYDPATHGGRFLFDARPELNHYELAAMEPISFTSRDGLTIHGYATFPPGADRSNLPAVLNVHGGPQVRDEWGWNPEAQWLANRGYLCVQVNYRGSTGYGKDFVTAGDHEWGAKMHDDLIDAVDYIVGQGWADRDQVAIYGGSYGGYAALVGAAFTPDVFRCAVDIVGPSNL